MRKITAVVLCAAKRLSYLEDCLDSLNIPDYFDQKILSVDQFDGHVLPEDMKNKYSDQGWTILLDNHRSKLYSLINALNAVTSDYVFYQEDDIVTELPDKKFILESLEKEHTDRECGWISMNLGGAVTDLPNRSYGDLLNCDDNTLLKNDDCFVFVREELHKNAWFFEFPAIFINKFLFLECLSHLTKNSLTNNIDIEQNLTKFWFEFEYDKHYFKGCVAKNNLDDVLLDTPGNMMSKSALIKVLDPNQQEGV